MLISLHYFKDSTGKMLCTSHCEIETYPLLIFLIIGVVWLFWVGVLRPLSEDKSVAQAELSDLSQKVTAYLSVGSVSIHLFVYLSLLSMGILLTLPLDIAFIRQGFTVIEQNQFLILFVVWMIGAAPIPLGIGGVIQGLNWLFFDTQLNSSASPPLEMDASGIVVRNHIFPWNQILQCQTYFKRTRARGGRVEGYLVLRMEGDTVPDAVDLLGMVKSWEGKLIQREVQRVLNLPPRSFLLIPMYGLSREQHQLMTFAKRYWCQSHGQEYKSESIEALVPQKSFQDCHKT